MLIAVDHGNYAVKTPAVSFLAGLTEYSVSPPLAEDVIEYEGRFWALTGSRIPYMRDKTRDDRYFILTLFAIAKELRLAGELPEHIDVDLAVGLPPEHFSVLKERFTQYFKRAGIKFAHNNTPTSVSIRRVFVYPQAYAAVVPQGQFLKSTNRIFCVDIGGFTSDVLLLRNGKPDLQFRHSLEMGVITMNNSIIGRVGALHDMKIDDDHIADVIQGRDTILPGDVIQRIRESASGHTNTILDKLRELQVDLRSTPAIFIGGGSVLFRPYLENSPMVVKAHFVPGPMANAIGYKMLAAGQLKALAANGGRSGEKA